MAKKDNEHPLLSVIVPCYKVEKYLDRCIESIINQTYSNLEIILVDDGSPDYSGTMCDQWAKKDNRIKVIHKSNGGLGFARNSGLEIATGNFIAFVDSDDYIDLTMYEKLISVALATDSDIVFCGVSRQQSDRTVINESDFSCQVTFEKDDLPALSQGFFRPTKLSPNMLVMSVWHSIYKKNTINVPFYSEREVGSEDLHFQISAVLSAQRVTFIPECLYFYCYNGESLSHSFVAEKINRYKKLSGLVNDLYLKYGIRGQAEYYVFVVAFVSTRQVLFTDSSGAKEYIRQLAEDKFWDQCDFEGIRLNISKQIFYICLKRHMSNMLYAISRLFSLINYKLLKKSHR